jgi:hypothetical protein
MGALDARQAFEPPLFRPLLNASASLGALSIGNLVATA